MLQLLSLTLAYDDTRFFGSVMFTNPTTRDDKPAVVLFDHADATALVPPDQRRPGLRRTRRCQRWSKRTASCGSSSATHQNASAAPPTADSRSSDPPCSRPTFGGSC